MTERGPYGDYYLGEIKPPKAKTYIYTVEWNSYSFTAARDFGGTRIYEAKKESKKFLNKLAAEEFKSEISKAYHLILTNGVGPLTLTTEEIEG